MIYPVPFNAAHALALKLQPGQAWGADYMTLGNMLALECDHAHTLMEDGQPLACCGVVAFGAHRALVWALVGDKVNRQNFATVHAYAKLFLNGLPFRRLEAVAEASFAQAKRWLELLGFRLEAPRMAGFYENGGDGAGYALVRGL